MTCVELFLCMYYPYFCYQYCNSIESSSVWILVWHISFAYVLQGIIWNNKKYYFIWWPKKITWRGSFWFDTDYFQIYWNIMNFYVWNLRSTQCHQRMTFRPIQILVVVDWQLLQDYLYGCYMTDKWPWHAIEFAIFISIKSLWLNLVFFGLKVKFLSTIVM